ncbi:MAG TPA: hypothetical protein VHQ90_16155 [Thermoanaerobaculia bacterium]|nr:hypothetical protein [Thermoanaerobaculia bacterium]
MATATAAGNARRGDRRRALALAVLCCALYLANLRVISEGDSVPARYLPFSLWRHGSLSLDSLSPLVTEVPPGKPFHTPYWLWRSPEGHLFSVYPIVTPLLLAPLYAPAAAQLWWRGWEQWRVADRAIEMEKLAAALLAAAGAGALYLLLRRRLPPRRAGVLAAAYALGTGTWSISSQALWQHGTAELLLILALLGATARASLAATLLTGLTCGLLAANRPPDALLAVAVLAALALERRQITRPAAHAPLAALAAIAAIAAIAALAAAVALAPFLWYNFRVFGHLAGGYAAIGLASPHPFYHHPLLGGMAGLLVSPAKGLLVFSPFLAFLVLRLAPRAPEWNAGYRALDLCLALAAAGLLVFYARTDWRGGSCYGPRFLTDLLPALVWLLAPVVGRLRAAGMAAFALAVALSIAVEAVGAFCYPRGGSDSRLYPPSRPWGEIGPEVWSWRGAPVLVEARAGCAPPDLLPHLLRALGRPRTAAR